jgi:ATP-dependent DNA helicase RecG
MDITQLRTIIAAGESLTVEFKGEEHGSLSDREIYEAVVCFANTDGGTLLIGVEDDHRITGARPRHGTSTDPSKLQAAIFNKYRAAYQYQNFSHTHSRGACDRC